MKKDPSQLSRRTWLILFFGGILGAILACALAFIMAVVFTSAKRNPEVLFCELNDPVVQAIMANDDAWIDYFTDEKFDDASVEPRFTVGVPQREYVVVPEFTDDPPEFVGFYVSVESGFLEGRRGAGGYVYSVEGRTLGDAWTEDYTVVPFGDNVFCYSPK
ncbi:MAG: hypothetical protein RLP44_08155 [Aggregatilineales bacterium]